MEKKIRRALIWLFPSNFIIVDSSENLSANRRMICHYVDAIGYPLFLEYELNEERQWHSTLSQMRQFFNSEELLPYLKLILPVD